MRRIPSPESPADVVHQAAIYWRELVAFASRQLGAHHAAADDMVQDAYVHLLARVRAGNPPEYARGWLYAVVRTRCAEERARRARITVVDPNDVPDVSPGPEDAVIGAAEGRWMLQRVLALPDSERVAVLAHLSGTPGAVTSAGGRSPNARYQALFRGRARLRKAREGLWGVLVLPVWLRTSTLRRALGSPITRSAFSGGAGVARIAVLVGTTLVTSLGVGPLIHVTEQMAWAGLGAFTGRHGRSTGRLARALGASRRGKTRWSDGPPNHRSSHARESRHAGGN